MTWQVAHVAKVTPLSLRISPWMGIRAEGGAGQHSTFPPDSLPMGRNASRQIFSRLLAALGAMRDPGACLRLRQATCIHGINDAVLSAQEAPPGELAVWSDVGDEVSANPANDL